MSAPEDEDNTMPERNRTYRPRVYRDLRAEQPEIAEAYDALGDACRRAGPLGDREQRLVKLGIAIGLSSEGGVRSHVRRGLDAGLTREELLHAIAIAVPTTGFPATAAAYQWASDVLDAEPRSRQPASDG
jgi:4-carboxymuconolactone decarboxylase